MVGCRGRGGGKQSYNANVPSLPASDIVYAAVAGPSVSVKTPGKPQSLASVPATHCKAYVVAAESCLLLGIDGRRGQYTYRANNRTDEGLGIRSWDVERDGSCLRRREACKRQAKDRDCGRNHVDGIQFGSWLVARGSTGILMKKRQYGRRKRETILVLQGKRTYCCEC
jgi:hypothetical protein